MGWRQTCDAAFCARQPLMDISDLRGRIPQTQGGTTLGKQVRTQAVGSGGGMVAHTFSILHTPLQRHSPSLHCQVPFHPTRPPPPPPPASQAWAPAHRCTQFPTHPAHPTQHWGSNAPSHSLVPTHLANQGMPDSRRNQDGRAHLRLALPTPRCHSSAHHAASRLLFACPPHAPARAGRGHLDVGSECQGPDGARGLRVPRPFRLGSRAAVPTSRHTAA